MKTKTYHISHFGEFAPHHLADSRGFVTYHDNPRYASASEDQLGEWSSSRITAVRAAAVTEIQGRRLQEWRDRG
jgi:hypothetical protein